MIARQDIKEYKKFNKGLYNAEDVETLPTGYSSDVENAVPLMTGGYKKRPGTKKLMSAQNTGKIVSVPYFEDRYFNKNKLIIENSGKFSKYNSANSQTDYSSQVVLKAAEKYGSAAFYKGVYDYLMITNGGGADYVKKVQYTPDGTWSELGTSVATGDDIRQIEYVSSTEIYAVAYGQGIYKWNGSTWSKSWYTGDIGTGGNLVQSFCYVSSTEMYAGVNETSSIYLYTGTTWS